MNRYGVVPFLLVAVCAAGARPSAEQHETLRQKALLVLRTAMDREARWVKVHAAEALLPVADADAVARTFERELASKGGEPEYRIGIWRVLAQNARIHQQHDAWTEKILAAFLDTRGPDRLHAAETLGKLGYRAGGREAEAFELAARTAPGPLAANARWVLANSGQPDGDVRLAELLASEDPGTRATAAYAVRHLPKLSAAAWNKLTAAVGKETGDNIVRASLLSAAFVHAPADQQARFTADLLEYARRGTKDEKYEVSGALATAGRADDLPLLSGLLDDPNADVRIGAANAIVRITAR